MTDGWDVVAQVACSLVGPAVALFGVWVMRRQRRARRGDGLDTAYRDARRLLAPEAAAEHEGLGLDPERREQLAAACEAILAANEERSSK